MPNNQTINEREKAIVRLAVYYPGKLSPALLYSVAYNGTLADAHALRDLPAIASRWWRSRKIQDFFQAETALYNANKDAVEARIESECMARLESKRDAVRPSRCVDYSRPENQRAKLNELINGAVDSHDALDAMKLMIQRQQDIAPEQVKGPQVRAYMPLTCSDCPLYAMASDVLRMRASQRYNSRSSDVKEKIDAKLKAGGKTIIEKYVEKLINK